MPISTIFVVYFNFSDITENRSPQVCDSNSSINSLGSSTEPCNAAMFFLNSCEEESTVHTVNR